MIHKDRLAYAFAALGLVACGDDAPASSDSQPADTEPSNTGTSATGSTSGTPATTTGTPEATETGGSTETTGDPTGDPNGAVLLGPTRGGTIAVNDAGTTLAVANKATGDVTLFALPAMTELARIDTGAEPSSVAWSPTNETLFVVNRASGSVTRIDAADSENPSIADTVTVGSELIHGALSPRGSRLYVSSSVAWSTLRRRHCHDGGHRADRA